MRENKIERHLIRRAIVHGAEIRKVKWIGRRGAPDRMLIWPQNKFRVTGIVDWVELKSTTGKLSPAQIREHQILRNANQNVFVFSSIEQVNLYILSRR